MVTSFATADTLPSTHVEYRVHPEAAEKTLYRYTNVLHHHQAHRTVVPAAPSSPRRDAIRAHRHRDKKGSDADAAVPPSLSRVNELKLEVSFNIGSRYRVIEVIGEGAYGVVCSAVHRRSGVKVAIKKIAPFDHQLFALRTLRELKLLCYWQESDVSENIISVLDIIKPSSYESFTEVYLIQVSPCVSFCCETAHLRP